MAIDRKENQDALVTPNIGRSIQKKSARHQARSKMYSQLEVFRQEVRGRSFYSRKFFDDLIIFKNLISE